MSAERPILFSAPMVRALLDGSKTQTRRPVKLPHQNPLGDWVPGVFGGQHGGRTKTGETVPLQGCIWHTRTGDSLACPYSQPGDRLWVRESFAHVYRNNIEPMARSPEDVAYMADNMTPDRGVYGPWKPSIHMPRWASRITLEITGVRVERLQDISEADAVAEGIETMPEHDKDCCHTGRTLGLAKWPGEDAHWARPSEAYASLWESINGPGSWDANPWVWVVEFRRVDQQLPDASKTIAKGAT